MRIYLEYKDEKSHKFWQISVIDAAYVIRYGRVGNKGTSREKTFSDKEVAQAQKKAVEAIKAKIKKGYIITKDPKNHRDFGMQYHTAKFSYDGVERVYALIELIEDIVADGYEKYEEDDRFNDAYQRIIGYYPFTIGGFGSIKWSKCCIEDVNPKNIVDLNQNQGISIVLATNQMVWFGLKETNTKEGYEKLLQIINYGCSYTGFEITSDLDCQDTKATVLSFLGRHEEAFQLVKKISKVDSNRDFYGVDMEAYKKRLLDENEIKEPEVVNKLNETEIKELKALIDTIVDDTECNEELLAYLNDCNNATDEDRNKIINSAIKQPKTPILLKEIKTYSIEDIKEQLIYLEIQSLEDIEKFLEKHNESITFDEDRLGQNFCICVGDLNIDGHFYLEEKQLLVIGDFNIKGTYNDHLSALYVTGTVRAEHFICEGDATAYADINGLAWHIGNDFVSNVGGDCFVEINDDKCLQDTCSSNSYYYADGYDSVQYEFVEEMCYAEDDEDDKNDSKSLDKEVLSEFLNANKPIFLFREQNEYKRSPTYGEYIDVATHTFWGINTEGKSQTIVTGNIGEKGVSRTKNFGTEKEAKTDHDYLISRQESRGYQFFRASCAILECLEWFDAFYKFDFEVCRSLDTAVMAKLNKEYSFSSAKNTSKIYYIELTGKSNSVKLELNHDAPALIHSIIEDLTLGKENPFCTYTENYRDPEVDVPTVVSTYNNLSIVKQKGLFGIIDSENNTVLEIAYCGHTETKEEHRIILELEDEDTGERTYGLYDFNLRRFILEPIFSQISFTDSKIVVVEGGKREFASTCNYVKNLEGLWATFNDEGPITNFQYNLVGGFSYSQEHFFVHKSDRLWEVLNSESFDFKKAEIGRIEFEVLVVEKENEMMGALSFTGELVIPFEFSGLYFDDARRNLYIRGIDVNDKYTYFTAKGEKTLDYRDGDYLEISGYPSCNRIAVRKDEDYYGIINIHSGEPMLPFSKDIKLSLSANLDYFMVNTIVGNKLGVIDTLGNYILQPVYDSVNLYNDNNIVIFSKNNLYKGMSLNTKEIIVGDDFRAVYTTLERDEITPLKDECVMVKKDGKLSEYRSEFYSFKRNKDYLWAEFDENGDQKGDYEYTSIRTYDNSTGLFIIRDDEESGIYSSKHSKFILDVKYKEIFSPNDRYAYITKKDGKWSEYVCAVNSYFVQNTEGLWGVFDKEGKQENAFEFDEIIKQKPGMNVVILTVNDKVGAVSFTGAVKIPFEYNRLEFGKRGNYNDYIIQAYKTEYYEKPTKFDVNGDKYLENEKMIDKLNDLTIVQNEKSLYTIKNSEGKILIPYRDEDISFSIDAPDYFIVTNIDTKKKGAIDLQSNYIVQPEWDYVNFITHKIVCLNNNKYHKAINVETGDVILEGDEHASRLDFKEVVKEFLKKE